MEEVKQIKTIREKLYGRKDERDGWEFHEKPGDMDTHTCRAFGFEELKK